MTRAVALRWGLSVSLLLLLGGPTPGAVGSCGSDELDRLADAKRFCSEREQLTCVRRALRLELSDGERDQCRRDVIERCEARSFAPECRPTERVARACLNALRALDTVQTPESKIEECSLPALCSVQPRAGTPTSIGNDAGMDE